jgi:ParB family chromosome partitioning protein
MLPNINRAVIKEIPLDQITVFISRTREEQGFQELKASIAEHGMIVPITVVDTGGGTYEVLKGEGRIRAHRELGKSRIRAVVLRSKDIDSQQKNIEWAVENEVREKLPPVVKARLAALDRDSGISDEEIAKRYQMKVSTAKQYVDSVKRASPKMLDMVRNDGLDFTKARAIAGGIRDQTTQESVAQVVTDGQISLKGTNVLVKMVRRATSKNGRTMTIPRIKSEIEKLRRRRQSYTQALFAKNQRRDILQRHAKDLLSDNKFRAVVDSAGVTFPQEVT